MVKASIPAQVRQALNRSVWFDFSAQRSQNLGITSQALRQQILYGVPEKIGPLSLRRRCNRIKYSSPIGLDDVFPLAYNYLQEEAAKCYEKAESTKNKEIRDKLLIDAEKNNPEVLYKSLYTNLDKFDYDIPVFRHYSKQKWFEHDGMILMQRLETLHVIPDTLKTLDPKCEVHLRFFNETGINKKIEPGEILSSHVTYKQPTLNVINFESIPENSLYSVLIVNPDVPDLEYNTYKTSLNWCLVNIPLSNNDNIIDYKKINEETEMIDYLPATPEKNIPLSRLCVWVFKQNENKKLDTESVKLMITRDEFDIREFVESNGLTAVGAHVWRSKWDRNVPNVRKIYNLPKGNVFHRVRK
ncbi:mitochondrial 54S ribosomal protein mL38 [Ascoidea rubescens DSM 1968]|uniref:Large ribosomal subunit protein mL38 n=1 Tax=Ascoidea rubescens DSM 1968 TaxID=1344418 RepID=A0A1D2VFV8_9ASCO|nr:PEBP-like protein [Ascoidea rubescens DSM 1968]ODV60479.1 PEBP-like protein [Ascoidea rubescens DSM 1968]